MPHPEFGNYISEKKFLERTQNTSQVKIEKVLYMYISWFIECKPA